jgi:hypothetical protein
MKLFPPLKALLALILIGIFSGNLNAVVVSFQQGENGYSGVQDTYILSTSPATITHSQTVVQIRDGWQGLLRFDGIFGTSPSQIPAGATILSAKLTLTISKGSVDSIAAHRVLVPWTGPTASWNFFDNGISVAAGEAHATPDQVFVPSGAANSTLELDVKASLQAWADGTANNGWVFFSSGTDTFRFHTSEHSTIAFRPRLVVDYVTSGPITITVQPTNKTVVVGQRVEMDVVVNGSLPHFFQWRKAGANIPGATNQTYVIPSAVSGDAGSYSVVVSNLTSNATSQNANLTVNQQSPLAITADPQGRTVNVGANVTLTVEVSGSIPRFQWYKDNQPIAGATNQSYTINNAGTAHSGNYHVVATNLVSSVTSGAAYVLVLPPTPQPYTVVPMNKVWWYNQTGANLGTAWKEINYTQQSTWPQGPGALMAESNGAITPLRGTVLTIGVMTYYFRTTFTLTNDPAGIILRAYARIDDGAVFYVNGQEVQRVRMPPGAINNQTGATGTPPGGDATEDDIFEIDTSTLVEGENVIAVEVHQTNLGSSDIVFGLRLEVIFPVPSELTLITQPRSQTIEENKSATLSVEVSGGAPVFQWFKDGQSIQGANRASYTIPSVTSAHAGNYHVVIGNVATTPSIVSSIARLTVIADTNPPVLVWAVRSQTHTNVTVTFDERVQAATAGDRTNYRINPVGSTATLNIISATVTNGTNVILATAPLNVNSNYVLTVNNVRDASPNLNMIRPDSQILIGFERVVMPFNAGFSFWDREVPGWFLPEFNDSNWAGGGGPGNEPLRGVFGFSIPAPELPVPINTSIDIGWPSYYFRHRLVSDASLAGARLYLRHAVDDGAIFYMNGVEFFRFNMPEDPITENTLAATGVGAAQVLGPIEIPSHVLRAGTNVFAARVHQFALTGGGHATDIIFGAELSGIFESRVVGPVLITRHPQSQSVMEGDLVTLDFRAAAGTTFQWQRNSNNIPGAIDPSYTFRARLSDNGAAFRVNVRNTESNVTSSNAFLTVYPDTNAPVLLSAILSNTMNQVIITFSEPLNPGSATTIGNYTVTNSLGQVQQISSATLIDPSTVLLTTTAPLSGSLVVRVDNITDDAQTPNKVASNSGATIGFENWELIPYLSTWKYLETFGNQGTDWRAPETPDQHWPSGDAVFEAHSSPRDVVSGQPVNTRLTHKLPSGAQNRTVYFRNTFDFAGTPGLAELQIRPFFDDGGVVYLNGEEVYRLRMPAWPAVITWDTWGTQTPAGVTIGSAAPEGPFPIPATALRPGQNLIAVEVHQINETSSDLTFDLELVASSPSIQLSGPVVNPCVPVRPELNYSTSGTTLTLTWTVSGTCPPDTFKVQRTSVLEGAQTQWIDVPNGSVSPVNVSIESLTTSQFFRLITR